MSAHTSVHVQAAALDDLQRTQLDDSSARRLLSESEVEVWEARNLVDQMKWKARPM